MTKRLFFSPVSRTWFGMFGLFLVCGLFFYAFTTEAAATPSVTLTANPSSSSPGAAVTLQWSASLYGDGQIPTCTGTGFSTGGARNGTATVNPNVTTTYSVNCEGVVRSATVTVTNNPPSATLSANPTSVLYGNATTLTWSSTNATSCSSIFNNSTGANLATGGATSGSVSDVPNTANNSYTITCSGAGGSATANVTVTAQQPPVLYLAVNPSTIQSGNSASLVWSSTYATSCTGTNFVTGGATSGSVSVSPSQNTTYTLTCQGNLGSSVSQSVVLGVNQAPIGVSCSMNPSPGRVSYPVTWFASAWGGTSPYSYSWIGDLLTGLTGPSVQATYDSAGSKNATVEVTDSWSSGVKWNSVSHDNEVCTGPLIDSDSSTEDGGTTGNMTSYAKAWARSKINDQSFGPAAFHTSPQNYCMEAHVGQSCDPSGTPFGSGSCPFGVDAELHSGNGHRATVSSDYSVVNGWTVDKYYGTVIYDGTQQSGGRTVSYDCPVLTVNADSDLTAGNASFSGTVNQPVTIAIPAQNIGAGSTLSSFMNTIWIDNDTNLNNGSLAYPQVSIGPLAAGATQNVSTTYTFNAVGTYYALLCVDNTSSWAGTITESNENNNCGSSVGWVTITISPVPQPDLTAGGGTFSGTAGQPVTITIPASNIGSASSGSSFTNTIWIDSDTDTANGFLSAPQISIGPLASGATQNVSTNYTFSSAGTYRARLCVDNTSSWVGTITESNENNNCSPSWATITVSNPPSCADTGQIGTYPSCYFAVSANLTASPTSIPQGLSSTLSWSSTNATSCTGSGFSTSGQISGTRSVSPSVTTSYTLTCTDAAGHPAYGSATVTVTSPLQLSITGTPGSVRKGSSATIVWSATGGFDSCSVSGPGLSASGLSGSQSVVINAESVFTLSCVRSGVTSSKSTIVKLLPFFIEQ